MEKDFRLFVKNLPININEAKIKELFGKYVTIKKIDLKEKKDLDNKINKFAFINVTTSDKKLNTCFGELNGERIDGSAISVELAKESFLDRLKRERNENNSKNEKSASLVNEKYSKPSFDNSNTTSKPNRKTFSDDFDFSTSDFQINESTKQENTARIVNDEHYIQESLNDRKSEKIDFKKPNDLIKSKKRFFDEDYSNDIESKEIDNKKMKSKRFFDENYSDDIEYKKTDNKNMKSKKSSTVNCSNLSQNPVLSESEKKRLNSLKQKRQTFKAQEQTIRNALRFVDNNKPKNKIIFDDNIDLECPNEKSEKCSKKKSALFDSDDEDQEELKWNEEELEAKADLKKKLLKLQTNIGNDKRFVLDERFVDDEDKVDKKQKENSDDSVEIDEKKWQLDILGNVLGKSITTLTAEKNDTIKKKNKMIRYDPTASNHQDYEVTEKSKPEKPVKKKKKSSVPEVKDDLIPKSSEVFYDVSENLVESLKQSEGFSLLKSFGRDTSNNDIEENQINDEIKENGENFKFNFDAKNPFKYDSSDDEGDNGEINNKNTLNNSSTLENTVIRQKDDKLFFVNNDSRFHEAVQFFKTKNVHEEDAFKHRRRELKEIVRSKIRNNLKKKVPWNRKKVRKVQKK